MDGTPAYLSYERRGSTSAVTHTVVPAAIGGSRAADLRRSAVDWAREQGLTVIPQCSYVRTQLAKQA